MSLLLACQRATADTIVIGGLDGGQNYVQDDQYPVLLALSGGGARGLAAIGILKALEDRRIRPTAIAGTSMGAIIGGLYAAGYSADDLSSILRSTDFHSLFSNAPLRRTMFVTQRERRDRHLISIRFDNFVPHLPRGITAAQKLTALLTRLTARANYFSGGDFSKLPIPFITIATDIVSGEEVVLDHGSLADAMRATIAFPLAFTGVEENGRLLMDGGMLIPVPVELVREMSDSVRFVIAINTATSLRSLDELVTPVDVAAQVTTIMTADKLKAQLQAADYVITPDLRGVQTTDFHLQDSIIQLGYNAGLAAADSILNLLSAPESAPDYVIASVEPNHADSAIIGSLREELAGRTLSRQALTASLQSVFREYSLFELKARLTTIDSVDHGYRLITSASQLPPSRDILFQFEGNKAFSDSTLRSRIVDMPAPFTPAALSESLDSVISLYRESGHDLAYVRDVRLGAGDTTLSITIDEGIIQKIETRHRTRTRSWFLLSRFPLHVGQPFSSRRGARGVADIFSTDLFDRVSLDLKKKDGGPIVQIGVDEKPHTQLRLGWHWDDRYRSEEFVELVDDHVFGIGLEILAHAQFAPDRQDYNLSYQVDRIWSTYLTAGGSIYYRRLDRQLYDGDGDAVGFREEDRAGFVVTLGQQIARFGTVTGGLIIEELDQLDRTTYQSETVGLRKLFLQSLVETFDRTPFPMFGKKHLFEVQFAGKLIGGDVEFTRFHTSIEAYWTAGSRLTWHPRVSIGISRSGLPPAEKFYLGGPKSFAGFATDELAGDKFLLLSNELRLKLPLRLYFSVRHDMGDTYVSTDQIKLSELRQGLGLFLFLDAPLGPVEVGYGVSDAMTNNDQFYLNIGYTF
ncbi:MAG: patatin-like phospholipase family protein [Candidatus Zixiibacteriota bacterium]